MRFLQAYLKHRKDVSTSTDVATSVEEKSSLSD
jgi:hypothetical protein